ncbi:MAG: hypothetical protein ACI93N_001713 [Flavobacteriaceae bacterium]|jgi:hypothetical protein
MKTYQLLSLMLFLSVGITYSQCPTFNIELNSQAEIDNFALTYPNCIQLTHELRIDGESGFINNLNGLSAIINAEDIFILKTQINNLSGLDNLIDVTSLTLWFNDNIQNLEGLSSLENIVRLEMFINNSLVDLSGMTSVQNLENISLFENDNLISLSHLGFITSINSFSIGGNAINSLSGLENLETVTGDFLVSNELLENFNDLANLQSIDGSLYITNNSNVLDISALDNIESLADLYIINCSNLQNFLGLENLTTVTGKLRIGFNPEITNLSFIKNIVSVGYLDIYENENLQTLQGIESIKHIEHRLFIESNPSLTTIEALNYMELPSSIDEIGIINNSSLEVCRNDFICSVIDDDDVTKYFVNNAQGCNSVEEVQESCDLSFTDIYDLVDIYPNPASDDITITLDNSINLKNTLIYSTLGKMVFETQKNHIDISTYKAGVYYARIITDKGAVFRKIVKE